MNSADRILELEQEVRQRTNCEEVFKDEARRQAKAIEELEARIKKLAEENARLLALETCAYRMSQSFMNSGEITPADLIGAVLNMNGLFQRQLSSQLPADGGLVSDSF